MKKNKKKDICQTLAAGKCVVCSYACSFVSPAMRVPWCLPAIEGYLSSTCCGEKPKTGCPSIFKTESPTSICPHMCAGPPLASPVCGCACVHACVHACGQARHRPSALASK